MSTKSLARTPLEAGHYGGGNSRRNGQNHGPRRTVRAQQREKLNRYLDEDSDVHVNEPRAHTRNADRLGAVKRWIISQAGRRWSDVYSDIATKFDFSTMAGRHILQHIEGYVDFREDHTWRPWRWNNGVDVYYPVYVDDTGMLLRNPYYHGFVSSPSRREYKATQAESKRLRDAMEKWSRGRSLGREGAVYFWFDIQENERRVWCEDANCRKKHLVDKKLQRRECPHVANSQSGYRYHVDRSIRAERLTKLTKEELAFMRSLPDTLKPAEDVVNGFVSHTATKKRK